MKKTVPCNLFEEGQTIYFNNLRLSQLEGMIGRSIAADDFIGARKAQMNSTETIKGLIVGLQHHYPQGNFDFYCDKLDEYYEKSGKGLSSVIELVLRAIVASGIYGKEYENALNGKEEPAERKNA